MKCYYHNERDAVASCKSCNRGLCPDCAVEVGNGLACRNRCENQVEAINQVSLKNQRALGRSRKFSLGMALLFGVIGVVVMVMGFSLIGKVGLYGYIVPVILGAGSIVMAFINFYKAKKLQNPGESDNKGDRK